MSILIAQFGSMGWPEMLVVGVIALLLFGNRLPEVARSLGKGLTEFKKGLSGVEDEISEEPQHRELPHSTETQAPKAPKFEPPPSPPVQAHSSPESGQSSAPIGSMGD